MQSEADTSSSIRSQSNDLNSAKFRPNSWTRWQDKDNHDKQPASPSLTNNLDMLHKRISTQAKIADQPSGVSDLTEHNKLKYEVARLRKVCRFTLGA